MKTALKAITGLFVLLAAIYGLTWTGVRADDVQGNCEGDPSPIPCETEDEPCGPLPDPVPVGPLVPVRSGDNLQISVIKVLEESNTKVFCSPHKLAFEQFLHLGPCGAQIRSARMAA